jgi:two-component system, LytTR family, sensor kinase
MNKKQIIKFHIGFWILVNAILLLVLLMSFNETDNLNIFLCYYILDRIFTVTIFYLFYFIVSTKVINTKKKVLYIISGVIILLIFSIPSSYFLAFATYIISNKIDIYQRFKLYYPQELINLFLFAVLGTLFKFIFISYDALLKQKELEKHNISNELALLRAQINPHFFFNTLNNIKSFASINSEKTLHIVDKLSETMSYILYESAIEKINFEKEIEFIRNYLELQKIRYDNPNYIEFKINGEYSNLLIPPLLFIPFIENAFKHGNKLAPSPGIKINFNIEKNKIFFEINNYLKDDDGIKRTKGGFGLINIRRRLDLLFDKNYNLEINNQSNQFNIKLLINYYDY